MSKKLGFMIVMIAGLAYGQYGTQQSLTLHAPAAQGFPGADGSIILDNINFATPTFTIDRPFNFSKGFNIGDDSFGNFLNWSSANGLLWLGIKPPTNLPNLPARLGISDNPNFYNVGFPAQLGVTTNYFGLNGRPMNGIQSSLFTGTNWAYSNYSAIRSDAYAPIGSHTSPIAFFGASTSDSANSDPYGMWITTSCSLACGGVTNGLIGLYNEARDFTGVGTSPTGIAAMEINVNTHSLPRAANFISDHLGINFARIGAGAGRVISGTALHLAGDGVADWKVALAYYTIDSSQEVIRMVKVNEAGAPGAWAIRNTPNWQLVRNTAADHLFGTEYRDFVVDTGGNLFLGGDAGIGAGTTMEVKTNGGGVQVVGGARILPTGFGVAPACVEGTIAAFTDSNTAVWGAVIAVGGGNHVLGYCNGTNFTVIGK